MADFFQNGIVSVLQNLGGRSLEHLEKELEELSEKRNMVLLLPALYSEFETPAMAQIIEELKHVKYLHKIILGLDRATREEFLYVKSLMAELPIQVDVLWNDGPRIQACYKELTKAGFPGLDTPGKGRNVWTMMGYGLHDESSYAFALHDCDIVNYSREIVARLLYPIIHPALDYEFNKGYYSRVTSMLHGRVTRLMFSPFIHSLQKVKGHSSYLSYMDSFRYALSGEFAFIRSLGRGIHISPNWGLEVSTLGEVYKNTSNRRICQTEIMQTYEHKHQEFGSKESNDGIFKIATDIAKTIFRTMAQEGVVFSPQDFKTLMATYYQESRFEISKYVALSKLNDLDYCREKEIQAVELFQEAIYVAACKFDDDPMGIPTNSPWTSVRSVLPDFSDHLAEAVALDKLEHA